MKSEPKVPEIQSAHAVLILNGNYLLQLRDNISTISAPGKWSLFGGRIEVGETPLETIKREVYEELSIKPAEYKYLWFKDCFAPFEGAIIRAWFFVSDVTGVWPDHKLREGKAARAFPFQQLAALDMPPVAYQTLERFHQRTSGEMAKRQSANPSGLQKRG